MAHDYLDNTTADVRLLGVPNIFSPFCSHNSASRVDMLNQHLSQAMILNEPEFNNTFTGLERELIDFTLSRSKRKHDVEIVKIIPKYDHLVVNNWSENCPQYYVIVLTLEENGQRHLDYFEINRYFMGSQEFGFIPQMENRERLKVGEILDKQAEIMHSPAIKGNQYCLGTNLNVCLGSFPETIEDAFIISESAAKKLETTQVGQRIIDCRQDRRPLNLNGDDVVEKFLPDIGSYVRDDGQLCAFRPVHWATVNADTDPRALREALPFQDDIIYAPPGAKIVDLTFNLNPTKINNCYPQAELYVQNHNKCWEQIYDTYLLYKTKYNLTPQMTTLVTTAIYRMVANNSRVPTLSDSSIRSSSKYELEGANRRAVDFLQVIVTYALPRAVHNGDKLTDLAGAKGVVGKIYPDDWMPVDEDGIRADLWVDMNSPVSRNNPGQLYEMGINRISEFVRRKVAKVNEEQGPEAAFEVLMEWYGDVNPNYEKLIREKSTSLYDKKRTVNSAIETSPKIWIPPFLQTITPNDMEEGGDFWNALINIKKWQLKWGARRSRIRFKTLQADGSGKEFISNEEFAIGSKYILHLHKVPKITAPGPASVNHIGIPVKSRYETKHYPVSRSPYRYGEDEFRVMAMDSDVREVVRLQNLMANSPKGMSEAIRTIILSEKPTAIVRYNMSNGDLLRSSVVLQLFHNTTAVLGVETRNTKTDAFDIREELAESIWKSDISGFDGKSVNLFGDEERAVRRSTAKRKKMDKLLETADEEDDLGASEDSESDSDV